MIRASLHQLPCVILTPFFCLADGWSPLQEAAARHYEDVCKALVDAGANLDHQNNGTCTICTRSTAACGSMR